MPLPEPTPLELFVAWQTAEAQAQLWRERQFASRHDPNAHAAITRVAEQAEARAALAETRMRAATEGAIIDRECDPADPDNRAVAEAIAARLDAIVQEGAR